MVTGTREPGSNALKSLTGPQVGPIGSCSLSHHSGVSRNLGPSFALTFMALIPPGTPSCPGHPSRPALLCPAVAGDLASLASVFSLVQRACWISRESGKSLLHHPTCLLVISAAELDFTFSAKQATRLPSLPCLEDRGYQPEGQDLEAQPRGQPDSRGLVGLASLLSTTSTEEDGGEQSSQDTKC